MAFLENFFIASAVNHFNVHDYSPNAFWSDDDDDDCDEEYRIILQFNTTLLDHMLNSKLVDANSVRNSIAHLKSNYSRTVRGKTPEDLDYNDLDNCVGYLHRYSACHTALVLKSLKKVFHAAFSVQRILFEKDSLHVISLGGGPGSDLLGFCSALFDRQCGFPQMTFTLVDQMAGWQDVFNQIVKMIRTGNYGDASALFQFRQVFTDFFSADLTNKMSWDYDLERRLEIADIFLLCKVLSVVPDEKKVLFLKNIVSAMKPGSVLIYIDVPFPQKAFAEVGPWLDCVYACQNKRFRYKYKVHRFGYENITSCQALVRVYVRR